MQLLFFTFWKLHFVQILIFKVWGDMERAEDVFLYMGKGRMAGD